jgi:hypothetical protein
MTLMFILFLIKKFAMRKQIATAPEGLTVPMVSPAH